MNSRLSLSVLQKSWLFSNIFLKSKLTFQCFTCVYERFILIFSAMSCHNSLKWQKSNAGIFSWELPFDEWQMLPLMCHNPSMFMQYRKCKPKFSYEDIIKRKMEMWRPIDLKWNMSITQMNSQTSFIGTWPESNYGNACLRFLLRIVSNCNNNVSYLLLKHPRLSLGSCCFFWHSSCNWSHRLLGSGEVTEKKSTVAEKKGKWGQQISSICPTHHYSPLSRYVTPCR